MRLVDLKVERGKIARYYQPSSKNVLRINEQIEETQGMLTKEVVFYRDEQAFIWNWNGRLWQLLS